MNKYRQVDHDVDECVLAYNAGGIRLADRVFKALVQARNMTIVEAVMFRTKAMKRMTNNHLAI